MAAFLAILAAFFFAVNHTMVRRALALGSNPSSCALVNVATNLALMWILFLRQYSVADLWTPGILFFVPAGLLAPGIFRLMMFHGMHRIGVSRTSAVAGATPMLSSLLAIAFLNERLTIPIALGTLIIVGGIVGLSIGKDPQEHWEKRYLIFPLTAIVCGSLRDVFVRFGMLQVRSVLIGATVALSVGITLMLVIAIVRRKQEPFIYAPRPLGLSLLAGFFTCGSYLTMYAALGRESVVRVSPLTYTAPIFIVAMAPFLLRNVEPVTRKTVVAVCFVVLGVVLITLPG